MWALFTGLMAEFDQWWHQHFFEILICLSIWQATHVLGVIVKQLNRVIQTLDRILERLPRE